MSKKVVLVTLSERLYERLAAMARWRGVSLTAEVLRCVELGVLADEQKKGREVALLVRVEASGEALKGEEA